MIGELKLLGYRGFESYRLSGLRRVNLLVGKNNSGKTSVLEAATFWLPANVPIRCRGISKLDAERYPIEY